jgi:hypothetical protein
LKPDNSLMPTHDMRPRAYCCPTGTGASFIASEIKCAA